MVTLYLTRFTTRTTSVSPSFTSNVGPGNIPFTVTMLCALHSLFTDFSCTCNILNVSVNVVYLTNYFYINYGKIVKDRCMYMTYNKFMLVDFSIDGDAKEGEKEEEAKECLSCHLCL